ncbi:hypothetical protein F2Q69_00050673 [Brassica cretica]|uniref:Uncharacterized protein n=1 Tax=Brassica cretica TaxID=69181 RepID=A0A8S9PY97_BRACR|nr:hypothetical protein F2Q69_00050673 [Brassica cretica]
MSPGGVSEKGSSWLLHFIKRLRFHFSHTNTFDLQENDCVSTSATPLPETTAFRISWRFMALLPSVDFRGFLRKQWPNLETYKCPHGVSISGENRLGQAKVSARNTTTTGDYELSPSPA